MYDRNDFYGKKNKFSLKYKDDRYKLFQKPLTRKKML